MEKLGIKIVVAERHGIRRYLYPVRVKLPSLYRRLAGTLVVAEADGTSIPSLVEATESGDLSCLFAVSLAPHESRELMLVRADADSAVVPDPISVTADEDGFVCAQERVEFEIGSMAQLGSVVYDGQQHLSGPVSITLDGHVMEPLEGGYRPTLSASLSGGLGARFTHHGLYADDSSTQPVGHTEVELTACKSWAWVRHRLAGAKPGSLLRLTLPLTVTSPIQTCDFGVGNGAYGKIEPGLIDEIALEIDLAAGHPAQYAIQSHLARTDEARIDYAGEIKQQAELASRLWLHWTEPTKSLAIAVTEHPKSCRSIVFRLSDRGVAAVEFETGESAPESGATFGVCCHFLNNVPAIAAATNPASILLPPHSTVVRDYS